MRLFFLISFLFFGTILFSQKPIQSPQELQTISSYQGIVVVELYANFSKRANSGYLTNCQVFCLDIEQIPQVQKSTNIRSLPMLLIYKNGVLVKTYNGNILLELEVPIQEVQKYINSLY